MKNTFLRSPLLLLAALLSFSISAQTVSDFENLALAPDSYWDGATQPLGAHFASGNAEFYCFYDTAFGGFWGGGFAYSSMTDSTTAGFGNQYSASTGSGFYGSANYVVGKPGAVVRLTGSALGKAVSGFYVTNSTYAYLSMKDGDSFSKKFGGASGNDPDWFLLTVLSWRNGSLTNDSVNFYLADFRSTNNAEDYIVHTWQWVDLAALGNCDSLQFQLASSDTGAFGMNTPAFFCMDNFTTAPEQFAPPAGQPGSTAISKDSAVFVAWATGCSVTRGLRDISTPDSGYAEVGDSTSATGTAGAQGVVSLGDGGSAILTFDNPIMNGAGWDFAVFENAITDDFLELAFVEVSSDGVNFFRFPATSLTQDTVQVGTFGSVDATKINNLAGKYRVNFGTPFDLEELAGEPGLDVNNITHVKIIDAVGSIQNAYATYDRYGNKVNDLWPTPFVSSGFDLDAVGVLHQVSTGIHNPAGNSISLEIFPNPVQCGSALKFSAGAFPSATISILDLTGKEIFRIAGKEISSGENTIAFPTQHFSAGTYFVKIETGEKSSVKKLVIAK